MSDELASPGRTSFVIVWTDFDRGRLEAATFGVAGDPLRAAFDVNDAEPAHSYPVVAASPGFVVAWTTETHKVKLQQFNGEARPVGEIIQVNTTEADPEHAPAIASLTDGNFAVAWDDFGVGVEVTGAIPSGLPAISLPTMRWRDQDGIVALAMGCMLLGYIEGVAAAEPSTKHREGIDLRRELLGLAAANVAVAAVGGYPAADGLSQTAVNERAGARSRLSLVFASATVALCLLFFTGLIADLPRAALAAVVLMAVHGLIDIRSLVHMWRVAGSIC